MYNCFMKFPSFVEKKTFLPLILTFLLGGLSVFSFAPFSFPFVIFLTFAALFVVLEKYDKSHYHVLTFGTGFFLSGVYWLVICLNQYGQMHFFLAALFTFILCIFLSLFLKYKIWNCTYLPYCLNYLPVAKMYSEGWSLDENN